MDLAEEMLILRDILCSGGNKSREANKSMISTNIQCNKVVHKSVKREWSTYKIMLGQARNPECLWEDDIYTKAGQKGRNELSESHGEELA